MMVEPKAQSRDSQLNVIIVGAGLGGLGAAIAILLAGHNVTILESTAAIAEVGAGIQILPNSSLILKHWGLEPLLAPFWTKPKCINIFGWKGNLISSLDLAESAARYPGASYWTFHRADLHSSLLKRVKELGGNVIFSARAKNVEVDPEGKTATVILHDERKFEGDLVVGADGLFSRLRDVLLGKKDLPVHTGDLAYRLLLSTKEILQDPELASFVTESQISFWLGPDAHVVNYALRGGELFNIVLPVPDDMPANSPATMPGNIEDIRALYKDWDPRISKLLGLCQKVDKWRLCIRRGLANWSHPAGSFVLLGDAVHATLPYLASGAGMSFEDGAVLGECLSRLETTSPAQKRFALRVYELCRKERTEMVVERSSRQRYLNHLHDGPEQEERDRRMRERPTRPGEALAWRDPELAPILLGYDHLKDVETSWARLKRAELKL